MHVSVEVTGNLDRKMTVQLPPERVQSEVDKRLKALAKRVRLDGFRPGKVPFKVVQQRYGIGVFQEVLGEVVQETFQQAIVEQGLLPAEKPSIKPKAMAPGEMIEYEASFQVFPEIVVADLADITIERPVAEIEDADVDRVIESLRKQQQTWHEVTRAVAEGDRVTLDFTGSVDGEAFEGGKAEGFVVEVGAGRLLPGFESQLPGLEPGSQTTIDVQFPDDYPAEHLRAKTAQFVLTVHKVEEARLPEVDAEFVRAYGLEDGEIAHLREEVRANMSRELEQNIKGRVKRQVMDALAQKHVFDLPEALVKMEIQRLRTETENRFGRAEAQQPLPDSMFDQEARRRVRLGLVIRAVVDAEKIIVDPARVQQELDRLAQTYDDPESVKRYYRSQPQAMSGLESMVLEDQVVEWVMSRVQVTDKPGTFERLMSGASVIPGAEVAE